MDLVPGDFFHRMMAFANAWNTFSVPATAVSILSIAVMIFCLKFAKKIPGAILVTFGATRRGHAASSSGGDDRDAFWRHPRRPPQVRRPNVHYDIVRELFSAAFTVAMLGAIESLMSAVVSDRMSNDKHNPNVELIGQASRTSFRRFSAGCPPRERSRARQPTCAPAPRRPSQG